MIFKTISALLIIAIMSNSTFAQVLDSKKNNTNQKISKKLALSTLKETHWEPNVDIFNFEKLPPKYNGISTKKIIDWVEEKFHPKKSEFEKQSEFEQRIDTISRVFDGKTFAFSPDDTDLGFKYEKYDADLESYLSQSHKSTGSTFVVNTDIKYTDLGSYVASNAYGKETKVTKFAIQKYGVQFNLNYIDDSGLVDSTGRLEPLKFPINYAKNTTARDIRFLYIGELESAKVPKESVSCVKPTFDNPSEGCITTKYYILTPSRVIIYLYSTGQILFDKKIIDAWREKILTKEKLSSSKVNSDHLLLSGLGSSVSNKQKYHLSHILLRSKERAEFIIELIKNGASFDDMAKYSDEIETKNNGGNLGYISISNLSNEVAGAVARMKIEQILDTPVYSPSGWHILRYDW